MRIDLDGDVDFQIEKILNEGIELDENVRGAFVEFIATGSQQEIEHNLGFIPNGFLTILTNGDVRVWAERITEWNTTTLFLNTSVMSDTVRLFVL